MSRIKERHRNGEKKPWRNGTITYCSKNGWFYREKGAKEGILIYEFLLRDVEKVFPNKVSE